MFKKIIVLKIVLFMITGIAFADQAEWINKSKAYKAVEIINLGEELRKFCPPCGDTTWKSILVKQVKVKNTSKQFYQVFINETGIDLAYFYIKQKNKWQNLAMILGLDVSGVPKFLPEFLNKIKKNIVHEPDKILAECMNSNSTTIGMVNCLDNAFKMWDNELNVNYRSLRNKLSSEARKTLKKSQLAWIKYRDLEFKSIDTIYSNFQGTMYQPMQIEDKIKIVKNRTLELKSLLYLFETY